MWALLAAVLSLGDGLDRQRGTLPLPPLPLPLPLPGNVTFKEEGDATAVADHKALSPISRLYLAYISPIPPSWAPPSASTSPISPLHLPCISQALSLVGATLRFDLPYISTASPMHLPGALPRGRHPPLRRARHGQRPHHAPHQGEG